MSVMASFLKISCAPLPTPLSDLSVYGLKNCSGKQRRMRSTLNWSCAKKRRGERGGNKIVAFQAGWIN